MESNELAIQMNEAKYIVYNVPYILSVLYINQFVVELEKVFGKKKLHCEPTKI